MQDRRRVELEAKRAKLAELKKAREDRKKSEQTRRESEVGRLVLRSISPRCISRLLQQVLRGKISRGEILMI